MFKIDGDTIHITRGDRGVIELEIDDYTFVVGDSIELRVYEKKGLEKLPVLSKEVTVTKECETLEIELTSKDTAIGNIENKQKNYWYEVELNDNNTVIGYDEEGPKLFVLYPEGVEPNE